MYRPWYFFLLFFSIYGFTQETTLTHREESVAPEQQVSRSSVVRKKNRRAKKKSTLIQTQLEKNIFFQSNIGVGFLYFSGIRANYALNLSRINSFSGKHSRDCPFKDRLSYNKQPLFEYLLGYQFSPCFKFALSYQHQPVTSISSQILPAFSDNSQSTSIERFTANLTLDGVMTKFTFSLPYTLKVRSLLMRQYLGVGVGFGWQSWTYCNIFAGTFQNSYTGDTFFIRQKISANALWMLDAGFQFKGISPESLFSLFLGCKYNQWGQARNIGSLSQCGGDHKVGFADPMKIKIVYQFAPYLGVQWNFPNAYSSYSVERNKSTDVWAPYFVKANFFKNQKVFWTQSNIGIGFLYFNKVRANLLQLPIYPSFTSLGQQWSTIPLRGRLSYNRTPLYEFLLGYQCRSWLNMAFSYQYQGGVTVNTKSIWAHTTPRDGFGEEAFGQFRANLSLNALMLKFYLKMPWAMIFKTLSFNPYLAIGVGPSWQSWTHIENNATQTIDFANSSGYILPLKHKFCANAAWMGDFGIRIQKADLSPKCSVTLGCKYNQWGQARNLGSVYDQGTSKLALAEPLRIKMIYQFSPYLGVQWNFADPSVSQTRYKLRGRYPNVWKPYAAQARLFQTKKALWTQLNIGDGFVKFSGVSVNFTQNPPTFLDYKEAPLKGRITANPTPIFEYLVGYQLTHFLKLALSYQYQGGVTATTSYFNLIAFFQTNYARMHFSANVSLNALMLKAYFELPHALIIKALSVQPYLAAGVGPGWQSWTQIQNVWFTTLAGERYQSSQYFFSPKICANAVWMLDAGLRVQSAYPGSHFSVLLGCKYNQWGQAVNIGKLGQQGGSHKFGLLKPLTIKVVYEFAPYIGAQWQF